MSAITTHVLDVVLGKPAAGIRVRLDKLEAHWLGDGTDRVADFDWVEISTSMTDADGRCRDLRLDAAEGIYRLSYDTSAYLAGKGRISIYPEISITFNCDGTEHYHLPVLLSDNGYTTYRGS
jgi:5-hydroxyisourate hydrolase